MLVALLLLGGLVAHPCIDQPLVDAPAGADRGEAVPQGMPARHDRPFAILQRPIEMVGGLILGQRGDARQFALLYAGQPALVRCWAFLSVQVAGGAAAFLLCSTSPAWQNR